MMIALISYYCLAYGVERCDIRIIRFVKRIGWKWACFVFLIIGNGHVEDHITSNFHLANAHLIYPLIALVLCS